MLMSNRNDKITEEKNFTLNQLEPSEIYNKNTDDHSDDSAVVAHSDIVKEHGEKATKGKNIVMNQMGIPLDEKSNVSKRQRILRRQTASVMN